MKNGYLTGRSVRRGHSKNENKMNEILGYKDALQYREVRVQDKVTNE